MRRRYIGARRGKQPDNHVTKRIPVTRCRTEDFNTVQAAAPDSGKFACGFAIGFYRLDTCQVRLRTKQEGADRLQMGWP